MRRAVFLVAVLIAAVVAAASPDDFHFVILGDRTGETQPGIWQKVWREAAASQPAFVISVGDAIQGEDGGAVEQQWREFEQSVAPYRKIPLYLTPGNHDIWSVQSEALYLKHSGRPLHYSFDYGKAHFTVLDNSRADELSAAELDFLTADLRAHTGAAVKFVFMHRPWIAGYGIFQQIARHYDVRYWITGHVHQMLHTQFDGVSYVSMPSAGGHLRLTGKYEDGWFFGWTRVDVAGGQAKFQIHDIEGHVTSLADWGLAGLVKR